MNDYIVLIDESGKPYIAHANESSSGGSSKSKGFGKGRGWRERVKYIAKWGEGAKARYFYTNVQLEAAMHQGRQKVSDAAQKAKEKASSAYAKGREALAAGKQKVSEIATKVPERLKDTVALRDKATGAIIKGQEAVKKIEDNAKNLVDKAKDVAGVDERERMDKAWDEVRKDNSSENFQKAEKARSDYLKTPLGKLDYAKERAWEIATGQDGTAKEIAEDLAKRAKEKAKETAEKAKEKASEAVDKARDAIDKAQDNLSARAGELKDNLDSKVGELKDNFPEKAKETVEKAKEKASETVEKAKEKAKDALGYDEKERMEAAQKEFEEKREEGIKLTEEREPIFREYWDYASEMEHKYGRDFETKMTESEKAKYDKLNSDLTEISEKWWDATIVQMHPSHVMVDPSDKPETAWDKLDVAKREYQATPLSKIEEFTKKFKRK